MSADRETLEALRERVRAATGPDRDIERDLAVALGLAVRRSGIASVEWAMPNGLGSDTYSEPPAYTASIDAALALVERVLPGMWRLLLHRALSRIDKEFEGVGEPLWNLQVLPPAILNALLAALIERGEKISENPKESHASRPANIL